MVARGGYCTTFIYNEQPMDRCKRLSLSFLLSACLLSGCAGLEADRRAGTTAGTHAYRMDGRGTPTVVFQSGLGDGADVWSPVFPRVTRSSAAIAYDRLGYGASSATRTPRDPCTIAREQHDLLRAAGARPPYVLVGHSLGGLYQYVYARQYPEEVAGLVLVDPTHPEHWRSLQDDAPAMAATIRGMRLLFGPAMRREFDDQSACLDRLDAARHPLPPARLLVRSNFALAERGGFETVVRRLQRDWLKLTGAERIEQVPGAGHYIQRDKPEAVIAAIEDMLRRARGDN